MLAMWMITAPWAVLAAAGLTISSLMGVFVCYIFKAVQKVLDFDKEGRWRP